MHLSSYLAWQFTSTLVYINSSLNPFIYCWKIREVKLAVKETLRRLVRRWSGQFTMVYCACFLAINSFQTKTCFKEKSSPKRNEQLQLNHFLYKRTLRYTKPIYSSKMGKAASRIYFTGEFQFCVQASGISRDSVTGFILLHEKFLQFHWLRAVVFQLNLKYPHVKITNLLWVVV